MNKFTESQRFNQWWLWAIIILAVLAPFLVFFFKMGGHASANPAINVFEVVIVFCVLLLVRLCHLTTTIDETGIYYRFFPFHFKTKKVGWGEIERAYVRKYSPIGEFGGWGYRISFNGGTAYNIAGNIGLQIVFVSGKKLLIGTQQATAVSEVLLELVSEGIVTNDMVTPPPAI